METIFGELERFGSEVIYPNRWIALPVAVALLAGALAVSWRWRLYRPLIDHKYITAAIGVPLLAIALPVGWYLLSPLWERSFLEEAAPAFDRSAIATAVPAAAASPPPTSTETPATPPATEAPASPAAPAAADQPDAGGAAGDETADGEEGARLHAFGEWQGSDDFHFARGQALLIETAPGVYILRVENFSVRNGPDLFVYLSRDPDGWEEDAVNLGALKATDGAFNYEIPSGVAIEEARSAVVWCRRFAVLFGHAPLEIVAAE